MWPICFATHTIATLPAPTCTSSGVTNCQAVLKIKMWGGGVAFMPLTILAPFCTILAGKWLCPYLPQSCHFPGLKQHLHNDLMLQIRIWGRGSGRCVPWVTLSQPDVSANTGNAFPLQPMYAFKPDQAWGLRPSINNQETLKWSLSRVGSSGTKCCVTSASPKRTAQPQSLPRPNPHRICSPFLQMCRHVKVRVWGCMREMVCAVSPLHNVFPRFPSTHFTDCEIKGIIESRKKTCSPMVCPGWETVGWLQSYALRNLLGHICLRKGWPIGGDDLHNPPVLYSCWVGASSCLWETLSLLCMCLV